MELAQPVPQATCSCLGIPSGTLAPLSDPPSLVPHPVPGPLRFPFLPSHNCEPAPVPVLGGWECGLGDLQNSPFGCSERWAWVPSLCPHLEAGPVCVREGGENPETPSTAGQPVSVFPPAPVSRLGCTPGQDKREELWLVWGGLAEGQICLSPPRRRRPRTRGIQA